MNKPRSWPNLSKREWATIALWLALLGTFVILFVITRPADPIDLRVYRAGGLTWLKGLSLYDPGFPAVDGPNLPFTYPPIAAVLFSLISTVDFKVAAVIITGLGVFLIAVVCILAARTGFGERDKALSFGFAIAALSLGLEPVRETLSFGQVNLVIMGLVAIDCLLPKPRWTRGMLVGAVTAIKLTPAIFVLVFIIRRQWSAVVTMVTTFVALGILGWILAPQDTAKYWFGVLLDPSRVGGLPYAANQSIRGLIARLGFAPSVEVTLWITLSLVAVAVACVGMVRAYRAGDDLLGLLLVATAGLLVSPVTWSHHWVWAAPALVMLSIKVLGTRQTLPLIGAFLLVLVFSIGPHWLFPREDNRELGWTWWQTAIGNAYVWMGAALLALSAKSRGSTDRSPSPVSDDRS